MSKEQCNKLIREKLPHLVHKTHNSRFHRYDYTYYVPTINDWLGLLPKDIVINSQGHLGKITDDMGTDIHLVAKFDLSKPFDSQSESFYRFLLENIT